MFIKNPTEGFSPRKASEFKSSKLKSHSYKLGHRLPVLDAESLLSGKKRRWIIEQLRQLCYLDEEYFQATYGDLIINFAEFVQVIPSHASAHLGSLLNESLAFGFSSLHQYLHQPEGMSLKRVAPNPMLLFSIFSAGLLLNIAKVGANQRVILTAEDGSFLKTWDPLNGSLNEVGKFFKLRFIQDGYAGVHYALTVLLARQIMPLAAFEWLSSDEQLFADWLNALRGVTHLSGRVTAALDASKENEKTYEELLQELLLDLQDVEQLACEETQQGEAFYQWLVNGIENNKIKVNTSDADIHLVPQGVFIEAKIYKQFADVYGTSEMSPSLVMHQFGNIIGIPKKGGNDFRFDQYFSAYPETRGATNAAGSPLSAFSGVTARSNQTRMGFVIGDSRLVFRHGAVPGTSAYMKAISEEGPLGLPNIHSHSHGTLSPSPLK